MIWGCRTLAFSKPPSQQRGELEVSMEVMTGYAGFECIEGVDQARQSRAPLVQLDCSNPVYLRIGDRIRLGRQQVRELIEHLQAWLATGSLVPQEPGPRDPGRALTP